MTDLPLFAHGPRIESAGLCSPEERSVASLLNTRIGADAAMKAPDVARAVGLKARRVQAIVRHLIVDHHAPIGTSMRQPYGWYLIETREEHEAVVNLHRSRALAELETMAAHSRQAVRALVRQVQTELLEATG